MSGDDDRWRSARRRGALSFGVVSSDATLRPSLEQLCNLLSTRLDVILYPQLLRSYGAMAAQVAAGNLDIAWVPPLVAADMLATGVAELVACTIREAGSLY